MSKMNELSIDHDAYEQYVEAGNNELRREGAEELRIEILRALDVEERKAWTSQERFAYNVAKIIVEQASI